MSHVRERHNGYLIMRSAASSSRLNLQHYLWRSIVGFDIHPRIPIPHDKALKVADIGTGTGIWMSGVKRQYPRLEIDGFDVSLLQCPPAEQAPPGCTYQQLDLLSNIPTSLHGVYDIVNLRLWLGAIHDDPLPTLRNLNLMLKPGGYLQWLEMNLQSITVSAINSSLDRTAMNQLLEEVRGLPIGRWAPRLPEFCAESGMVDARMDKYHCPSELVIPFCQNQFGAFEEISIAAMDNETEESHGPKLRRLLEKAHDDLRKGVFFDYHLECTVARKAG